MISLHLPEGSLSKFEIFYYGSGRDCMDPTESLVRSQDWWFRFDPATFWLKDSLVSTTTPDPVSSDNKLQGFLFWVHRILGAAGVWWCCIDFRILLPEGYELKSHSELKYHSVLILGKTKFFHIFPQINYQIQSIIHNFLYAFL